MSAPAACEACLRRTWLVARLAPHIEIARYRRRPLREILALSDETLLEALAGSDRDEIAVERAQIDPADLGAGAAVAGLEAVCRHHAAYPPRLLELSDAPAVLFVAGGVERLTSLAGGAGGEGPPAVAVVGMRRASADGVEIARMLGRGLGAAEVTVVSGMALGIDSAAHAGALEAGARTVAVLAGGPDVPYPRRMASLYRSLVARACVVSEMPPGFMPFKWCFPARNRIIAALAQLTVVVEAAERSGALITAEIAADLGREVAAVPGPVTASRSQGTNALLRDGATFVRDARDVLDAVVGVGQGEALSAGAPLPAHLQEVLDQVSSGRDTLALLAAVPGQSLAVLAALGELELLGRLRRAAGGRYVVVPA